MLAYLSKQLQVDARSLALGRIALAACTLFDLAQRACNITAHYSDEGVMPRAALADPVLDLGWSLHTLSGSSVFEGVLMAVAALCAVAWLVGWQTRVAQVVLFLLTISLQARNPYLRDGQDDWLHVAMFWTLWLPLGRCYSVDAWAKTAARGAGENRVDGVYALPLVAQLLLIYASAALGKCQSAWWRDGVGLERALELEFYERAAGHWLRDLPALTHALSYAVIATEFALPLLLFVPRARKAVVIAFCLFHASMGVFLSLGVFPWLCMATWILFWPRGEEGEALRGSALQPSQLRSLAVAAPFFAVCALTVINGHVAQPLLQRRVNWLAVNLGLDQYWVVFSPHTPISTGYMVVAAKSDGGDIDLFAGGAPLTWQKPELVASTFRDRRWRQFYRNLLRRPEPGTDFDVFQTTVRQATARWWCHANDSVSELDIVYVAHQLGGPQGGHRVPIAHATCHGWMSGRVSPSGTWSIAAEFMQ